MPNKPNKHKCRSPHPEQSASGGILTLAVFALRGTLAACLIGTLLLLAAAGLALAQDDPDRLVAPLGYGISAIIALTAGLLASRQSRRAVLLCGLFSAAWLWLIFFLLSLIPIQAITTTSPAVSLALHAALLSLTTAGAYLGRRRGRR